MNSREQELVQKGKSYLYPNYRQPEIVLVRGEGCRVWDASGRSYLDLYGGIAVSALGHAHPELSQALADQAAKLLHISNYYYNEPNVLLAERLCQRTGMDRVLFSNSGAEAIEAMLKLARRHFFRLDQPQRHHVIAFKQSFHGRTLGALAVTGQEAYRDGFGPLPAVKHVAYGDAEAVAQQLDDSVAAVLVEPVQGEGGVLPAPPGFLAKLRDLTHEAGALLLGDEIQTGVGRTGRFLGFEHSGVQPDAIAMAKGLGGGVPIGAMLCNKSLIEALPPGSHGSTFGGNPLASRAALVVLDVVERQALVARAKTLGAHLAARLTRTVERYPGIVTASRGIGLLQALVLQEGVDARAVLAQVREKGVMLTLAGGTALRFSPPLIVTQEELDEGVTAVEQVLGALP